MRWTNSLSKHLFVHLLIAVFFALITCLWLWPAPTILWNGQTIGIGTDDLNLPYFHDWILKLTRLAPSTLLNGALYTPQMGAPLGCVLWMTYIERIFVLLSHALLGDRLASVWQTPFWFLLGLHTLSATLGTAMGRRMKLPWTWALTLGMAMTFTPYTYQRSTVHMALSGVFFLPALLLAWDQLRTASRARDLILPAVLLFLCGLTTHYLLLVMMSLFIPLGVLFFREVKSWRIRSYAGLAFIPLAALLLWTRAINPIPEPQTIRTEAPLSHTTVDVSDKDMRSWALLVYAARPLDYLTGNYIRPWIDINPLRSFYTERLTHEPEFYPQERSSGQRWTLLLAFGAALLSLTLFRKTPSTLLLTPDEKRWILLGLIIALWSYVFSLSPRCFAPLGIGMGPSRWVQALFPEMRAPNRWSVGVTFGVAVAAMVYARAWLTHRSTTQRFRSLATIGFLALCWLEFLPTFAFPVHDRVPSFTRASPCGLGIVVPYLYSDNVETYRVTAALTQNDCHVLNHQQNPDLSRAFYRMLGPETTDRKAGAELLRCLGTEWAELHSSLAKLTDSEKDAYCHSIGFAIRKGRSCERSPDEVTVLRQNRVPGAWKKCLKLSPPNNAFLHSGKSTELSVTN